MDIAEWLRSIARRVQQSHTTLLITDCDETVACAKV